ncbi:rac serine-threonine kinase, putative [Leishmania panamensis]|uniref:Rac serine-threonine kinase, putative n=2 Tax=Leishmania guyanensis species complex TaxID=38579 RepID=A0A088RYE5_LEIPA|nr:rac serine-threonine kinase, putative [Leishmania panamensis]AIO00320.1 rac serine-threonine kinase, putative [Leishmania panamensis]
MSGYLKVLSQDGSWETRYIEIDNTKLYIWRTKGDKESGAAVVKELDLKCATLREVSEPNTWAVQPEKAEATYFQADGEGRKTEWMDTLRHYNSSNIGSEKVTLRDFEKKFVLGKGSYGKVFMVVKKDTDKWYAMKEMSAEKMRQAEIKAPFAERIILEEIDHPFIVHLHYSFQEQGNLYMILDLLAGGELFTYIEQHAPLDEEVVKFYAAEVALALGYLHSRNIIYRDLKPENVVFDHEGHACLTDFGLAKANVHEPNAVTYCGTNEYLAPELLKGVPHGKAVDWWSLGLMMCEMLFNDLPFYDENPMQMQMKILTEDVAFPSHIQITEETKDLIRCLLNKNPERRLQTLEEFKAHKCFSNLDFGLLEGRKLKAPITPDPNPAHNFAKEFTSEVIVQNESPSQAIVTLAGYTYDRDSSEQEKSPSHSPTIAEELRQRRASKKTSSSGSEAVSPPVTGGKRTSNSSSAGASAKQAATGPIKKVEHHIPAKVAPQAARKKLTQNSSFDKAAK